MNSRSNRFVSLAASALLCGCHSAPPRPHASAPAPVPLLESAGGAPAHRNPDAAATTAIPPRAAQQYAQALDSMKAGRSTEAESEFKQLSAAYPQFAGPQLNLGLIYLHDSRLADARTAFEAAAALNPTVPVADNELGITLRKLGKFDQAEAAYQRAIAADPNYAAAHLNLGVLYDLYLAQPQKALEQFESYLQIAGDNKQVAGWVVELRQRVGASATKKEPA